MVKLPLIDPCGRSAFAVVPLSLAFAAKLRFPPADTDCFVVAAENYDGLETSEHVPNKVSE